MPSLFTTDSYLSRSGLRALADAAEGQSHIASPGGLSRGSIRARQGASGLELTHDIPVPFWARIVDTGRAVTIGADPGATQAGQGETAGSEADEGEGASATAAATTTPQPGRSAVPHAFVEVKIDPQGVVRVHNEGRFGTITRAVTIGDETLDVPAYELSGRVAPVGCLVLMWPSDNREYTLFSAPIGGGLYVRLTGCQLAQAGRGIDPALGIAGPPLQYSYVESGMLQPGLWADKPGGMTDEDFAFPAYCVGNVHVPLDGYVRVRLWPVPFAGGIVYLFFPPTGLTWALCRGTTFVDAPQIPVSRITTCRLFDDGIDTIGSVQYIGAQTLGDQASLLYLKPMYTFIAGAPLLPAGTLAQVGTYPNGTRYQVLPTGVKFLPNLQFSGNSGIGGGSSPPSSPPSAGTLPGTQQMGSLTANGNLAAGKISAVTLIGSYDAGVG